MNLSNCVFEWYENITSLKKSKKSPIFIIGAPRSGSTLLYQCMTSYFDLAYFNNFHHKNYLCPSFAELRKRSLKKASKINFSSHYGFTKGEFSPSESWDFWYRFFRKSPHYVNLNEIDQKDLQRMKNALNSFMNLTQKNLLIKNLTCTARIEPIINTFPNSYWIISYRNILSNAYSIAKMRLELNNDLNKWESVQPRGYEKFIESSYEIQIIKQIELIYETIISDLHNVRDRVSIIKYEDFCNNPNETLERLNVNLLSKGIEIPEKSKKLPNDFTPNSNFDKSVDTFESIAKQFEINKMKFQNQFKEMINKFNRV